MATPKLRLLKPSELTVTPVQEKQVYILINSNDGIIGDNPDAYGTYSNRTNSGFANLIRKFTVNNQETN
jgi:hypothetical protein